ncbi:MAG: glycosyltransferase [Candidatus Dormibacterales bacterium]
MDRQEAENLLAERQALRHARDFAAADGIRARLREGGWDVADTATGSKLQMFEAPAGKEQAPPRAVTLLTIVHGWQSDAETWLLSVFTHCKSDFECVIVDNSADPRIAGWLKSRVAERLRVISIPEPVGFGAAVNAGIRAAAGEVVVLFDPGTELKGDAVGPLLAVLADPSVALAGPFGLRGVGSLKEFSPSDGPEVDAIEGYCMAFRRADAIEADGFDPKFRFYRIADIEFSFRLRARGGRAVAVSNLPIEKHEHRLWEATEPSERDRLSRRNLYRFLDRWGERKDLLTAGVLAGGARTRRSNRLGP